MGAGINKYLIREFQLQKHFFKFCENASFSVLALTFCSTVPTSKTSFQIPWFQNAQQL